MLGDWEVELPPVLVELLPALAELPVVSRHDLSLDGATRYSLSVPPFLPTESITEKVTCVCAVMLAFQLNRSKPRGVGGRANESEPPGMSTYV